MIVMLMFILSYRSSWTGGTGNVSTEKETVCVGGGLCVCVPCEACVEEGVWHFVCHTIEREYSSEKARGSGAGIEESRWEWASQAWVGWLVCGCSRVLLRGHTGL